MKVQGIFPTDGIYLFVQFTVIVYLHVKWGKIIWVKWQSMQFTEVSFWERPWI